MIHKACFAAALAVSSALAQAAPVNLLVNGNFEANIGNVVSGSYTQVAAGSSLITGWTVGGTSVDLIRNAWGSIDSVSIDLAGTPGPGSLSQTFSVLAGVTYELEFDYFRNPPGTALTVNFGGLGPVVLGVASSIVRDHTLRWTALSDGMATVSFTSGGGNYGPTIDNVSVTAVPAPATATLAFAALLALAAVSRRQRAGKA